MQQVKGHCPGTSDGVRARFGETMNRIVLTMALASMTACALEAENTENAAPLDQEIADTLLDPAPPPGTAVDLFTINPDTLDVLLVVDDSCSMAEEQGKLAGSRGALLARLFADPDTDVHLGAVTTDMVTSGRMGELFEFGGEKWIDNNDPPSFQSWWFKNAVNTGTTGSFDERPLDAIYAAIETHSGGVNQGFYRRDADLAVIVMTDEADYSNLDLQQFGQWARALKDAPYRGTVHAIVNGRQPACPATAGFPPDVATDLLIAAAASGGSWYPICAQSYGNYFDQLGAAVAPGPANGEFTLSDWPIAGTLDVTLIDTATGAITSLNPVTDYDYDPSANVVTGLVPLTLGAQIEISYGTAP